MPNRIRVLIADDQVIAREGMQRIIERADDIEVLDPVSTAPEVLVQVRRKRPDVLLLDLRWHHDDHSIVEVIAQIRKEYPNLCIVGVTAYDHLIPQAKEAGATWVISKYVGKDELIRLIRTAYVAMQEAPGLDELSEAQAAWERIRHRQPGVENSAHENDIGTILETVLFPYLTDLRRQPPNFSGTYRRDLLFANYTTHPFWQNMVQLHGAGQVVFEVKNTAAVELDHVSQLSGYLGAGLGRLGFIVARSRPAEAIIRRSIQVFHDDRKAILFLCDDDLSAMLQLKEAGEDPTAVIAKHYNGFVALP